MKFSNYSFFDSPYLLHEEGLMIVLFGSQVKVKFDWLIKLTKASQLIKEAFFSGLLSQMRQEVKT